MKMASAGLPGGLHSFRRYVATELAAMMGNETAATVLNHQQQHNVLNRRYTGGAELVDLVRLRAREDLPEYLVSHSPGYVNLSCEHIRLNGLAAQAIAASLSETRDGDGDGDDTHDDKHDAAKYMRKHPREDVIAEAREHCPEMKDSIEAFNSLAATLPSSVFSSKKKRLDYDRFALRTVNGIAKRLSPENVQVHKTLKSLQLHGNDISRLIARGRERARRARESRSEQATGDSSDVWRELEARAEQSRKAMQGAERSTRARRTMAIRDAVGSAAPAAENIVESEPLTTIDWSEHQAAEVVNDIS